MLAVAHARSDDARGTIVFIRHGEKPDEGLGQLTCQGLNRALALPTVIDKLFGKPDAIFAPNPSNQKEDNGKSYYYVRPLATVEPTAIQFGLPVDTSLDYSDAAGLQSALESWLSSNSKNTFILVAWEHKVIQTVAKALLAAHSGDQKRFPSGMAKISTVSMSSSYRPEAAEQHSRTSTNISTNSRKLVNADRVLPNVFLRRNRANLGEEEHETTCR